MEPYKMSNSDEMEIDLLDFCATLLRKWKPMLISGIIVGLLGAGYALAFGTKKAKEVTPEQLENAINELSETDAREVESLYSQHESYKKYKEQLQKYYSNYIFEDDEAMNYIIKQIKYNVSSKAYGGESILTGFSLTPEIYDQIKVILSDGDELTEVDVYKHVSIGYSGDGSEYIRNFGTRDELIEKQGMLTVTIYGKNEGQCSKIQQIVDEALHDQLATARKVDPDMTLTYVGESYYDDVRGWIVSQQNNWFTQIQDVDKMITNVETQVKALSSEQTTYYKLLEEQGEEAPINPRGLSWKKFLVLGAVLGIFLQLIYYAVKYLFDGNIKTEGELYSVQIPVLNRIALKKSPDNRVTRAITRIRKVEGKVRERDEAMAASDIALMLKKADAKSVYLVCSSGEAEETATAETLQKKIQEALPSCNVMIGQPLSGAEELKKLGESACVVFLVSLKQSKRFRLRKCLEFCDRQQLPVLGAVSIEHL